MHGTLVIGCGGTGCRVAGTLADLGYPVLTINWHDADICLLPPGFDENDISKKDAVEFLESRRNEISLNLVDVSDVVVVTSSGGNLGSACLSVLSECVRGRGCRFICLLTLPFVFEGQRRDDAMEKLPELLDMADRTFVIDLQDYFIYGDMMELSMKEAMEQMEFQLSSTSARFANMIGSMPFMSTFASPSYYYFRSSGPTLHNALVSILDRVTVPVVPTSPDWRMVVCPDKAVSEEDARDLARDMADRNGSIPEIIRSFSNNNGLIPDPALKEGSEEGLSLFIPIYRPSE